jgi:SMI1-KNR4 cell-wall
MFLVMRDARTPTTDDAIDGVERKHSIQFPGIYRAFLLDTNGGQPLKSSFPIKNGPRGNMSNVQVFLGIGVKVPSSELEYPLDLFEGGLPKKVVPIATQDNGDYICFDLRNESQSISYWDHRHFWSTGEWRESDLYHVADTFQEFLGLLRPNPG